MPEGRHVVVCADASPDLGLGHVMRSLVLAHELTAAGCATTICGVGVPADLLGSTDLVTRRDADDVDTVIGLRPDFVVVDGDHFTADFFAALDAHGIGYAVIDDNGDTAAGRPVVVVNQNPHAKPAMYDHLEGNPLLLLGVRFALLRPEIDEIARQAPARRAGTVFVAFGGSDPRRLTEPVAVRLASEGLTVRVAVGPVHPERAELVSRFDGEAGVTVTEPEDYATELATASVAVLAAGSSLLEAAALDTPAVAVIVSENQRRLAAASLDQGVVFRVFDADEEFLRELGTDVATALGSTLRPDRLRVPGSGARLVAASVTDRMSSPVRLRPASIDDAAFVFSLRTDADVQQQSFGAAPTWEQHLEWFRATIDDPRRRLMIVERASDPIGQIRLDDVGDHEVVSLAIAEPARGRGLGRRALGAATALAVGDLVAHIRPDNARSLAAFSSAGFVVESENADEVVMRRSCGPRTETAP